MGDKTRGVYRKYRVERTDGRDQPGGDREGAAYFVLDLTHDALAAPAVLAYADAAEDAGYHALATDLRERVEPGLFREPDTAGR